MQAYISCAPRVGVPVVGHPERVDAGLAEAGTALSKALRALQSINHRGLAEDTLQLANRVLLARQGLRVPSPTKGR